MSSGGLRGGVLAIVMGVTAIIGGCGDDPTAPEFEVIEEVDFHSSLNIDLSQMTRLTSGVYIEDLVLASDSTALLAAGDIAVVDHTGWLVSGEVFSQGLFSYRFYANPREVIPGFQDGMAGMRVGVTRRIIIPPAEGYGASPPGDIPSGAVLVFEVELMSVNSG
jgi:FKBP-type peptidyl-prolyl cis-trans isomerase